MVSLKSRRLALAEMLMQPEVADQLRQRFRFIQDSLTTTIHEASALTGLTEAQLRYAESRRLLSPNRVLMGLDPGSLAPLRGQRRYTVEDLLSAHLIAFLLEHNFSLGEIASFMESNTAIIHDLLETSTLRLKPVLDSADEIIFKRFFLPRILYYALSLIFERDGVENAGIVFPVRANPATLSVISPGEIETADDLIHLGHITVAWRARGRPFSTFITAGNPFERDQQVRLAPFTALKGIPFEDLPASSLPFHAYIAYRPEAEPELFQADHLLSMRQQRYRERATGGRLANPRTVAGRLIRYVQSLRSSDLAVLGQTETTLSEALFFNSPQMTNDSLGDALLNQLADALVGLGGEEAAPVAAVNEMSEADVADAADSANEMDEAVSGYEADGVDGVVDGARPTTPARTRWRFSCVLTPRDREAPLKRHELVVRAQSKAAPHRIGVTTTSPQQNGGLTIRAYSSGHIAYRPEVIELDPAVSYVGVEYPIGSAIAVPAVDGHGLEHSQPPAVIYVASELRDAFDDDDFLLLRVMGRLVGEIVQSYYSRGHLPSALTDTLNDPEMVDSLFADFRSELSFVTDLQKILLGLNDEEPTQPLQERAVEPLAKADDFARGVESLTLVGFDVNDLSLIQRRQGARIARLITREIGNRLKQRVSSGLAQGVPTTRLYRIWGDRFYLLMRNEDRLKALQRCERIRKEISGVYQLDGDIPKFTRVEGSSDATHAGSGIQVGVRMAGMTLTNDELRAQLCGAHGSVTASAANLSRLLEEGLRQAYDVPNKDDRAIWWNVDYGAYEQAPL